MTLLGQEIIKATSKTLPNQPGVYQMQDDKGNILYIGKAKVLSNRVKNYLSLNNLTRSCLLYTSPSPRDGLLSRMPSSA